MRAAGSDAAWAAAQALRCPGFGGVVLAAPAPRDGLAAAAAEGGGIGLLLDPGEAEDGDWLVEGLAAGRLAHPSWQVTPVRRGRGRAAGPWVLTWRAGDGALVLEG